MYWPETFDHQSSEILFIGTVRIIEKTVIVVVD